MIRENDIVVMPDGGHALVIENYIDIVFVERLDGSTELVNKRELTPKC
jgi:hypothetical protein